MKKPTQITPEQKKDLKALSRMPTEANKRRHRSGGTAQPGRRARYRPCAAQAPPSRRTKISTTQRFFNRRAAEDCGPYHWVGWAPPSCRRGGFRQDVQDWRDASRASRPSRLSRGLPPLRSPHAGDFPSYDGTLPSKGFANFPTCALLNNML